MQPMNPLLLTDTIDVEEAKESVSALGTWLSNFTQTALSFLVRLGIAIVIYLIVSKVLKKVLQHLTKWLEKKNTDPSVSHFMIAAIKYTVLVFTVVMIIVQLDIVEASSIAALIASAGVAISLALQGVLSNLAGGILILILRPFREGITSSSRMPMWRERSSGSRSITRRSGRSLAVRSPSRTPP